MSPVTIFASSTLFSLLLLLCDTTKALELSDACPNASVYTPFTKWPKDMLLVPGITENTVCWWWAECVIDKANEVRKQQFAATSLVMGLVPLILKEIAWPERKVVYIPQPLAAGVEIIVRALGLLPIVKRDSKSVGVSIINAKMKPGLITLVLSTLCVLVSYAALALLEIYSKRSSLECPYPIFALTWFIIALVPASLETISLRLRSSPTDEAQRAAAVDPEDAIDFTPVPIFGGEKQWTVQLIWSIYYAAGTLVYSSIMAVTVVELVVWVIVSCFTVGTSKLLAYRLCGNWR